MPSSSDFPHLNLTFKGDYKPKFQGRRERTAEEDAARQDPRGHANKFFESLDKLRIEDEENRLERVGTGQPAIPADKGVLLKLPDGIDAAYIAHALGVELVAETEEGLMLVSSQDISFQKLRAVLSEFSAGTGGKVAGSSLQEIIYRPDDQRRLNAILGEEVLGLWPLNDEQVYIFDLGIQTATDTRDIKWPSVKQRTATGETESDFQQRRENERRSAWENACIEWDEKADERVDELRQFIRHYDGNIIRDMISDQPAEEEHGMVFPDSVQVRVEMRGQGFKDVIQNFAHLFDVAVPPEILQMNATSEGETPDLSVDVLGPSSNAPTVCVIDSGIQEEHRLLAPAIDHHTSKCFIPGVDPQEVADYVEPSGHGTRVAGVVLYPHNIPTTGEAESLAWIQNARVLNGNNCLSKALPPETYLQQVVAHFHVAPKFTKIFNHSINSTLPCPTRRMTSWAAKIDQLSHEYDVLFIQSAGNQTMGAGNLPNPGLTTHLNNGLQPPAHHFEASMRIANPGQSLHALTVGSVSAVAFEDDDSRSFSRGSHHPSGFSRSGYGQPWSVVKPEVVEVGGDVIYSKIPPYNVREHSEVSVDVVNSTLHGSPAVSKDGIGTSFSAPKVAHIAAHLQKLFPDASPLLYRALIVQSARWPAWAEATADKDKVLRLIGYGLPSLERATSNAEGRVTLVIPDAETLPSKQLHLYTVPIPAELRNAALEARVRIDITLAYTALPRRTRSKRTGYLETWLDWRTSNLGETADEFLQRMTQGGDSDGSNFNWTLHTQRNWGDASHTNRQNGSVQKDWAVFEPHDLPQEFSIAVRSHNGWNHRDGAGSARYCLVVSFEVLEGDIPIYALIQNAVRVDAEVQVEN